MPEHELKHDSDLYDYPFEEEMKGEWESKSTYGHFHVVVIGSGKHPGTADVMATHNPDNRHDIPVKTLQSHYRPVRLLANER